MTFELNDFPRTNKIGCINKMPKQIKKDNIHKIMQKHKKEVLYLFNNKFRF
jgi:hypothetical protein